MARDIEKIMESAGYMLYDAGEPGIYVRAPQTIEQQPIDWNAEPTGLLREMLELNEVVPRR